MQNVYILWCLTWTKIKQTNKFSRVRSTGWKPSLVKNWMQKLTLFEICHNVWQHFQTPRSKFFKNTPLRIVFSTLFSVFGNVLKHGLLCLICYVKHPRFSVSFSLTLHFSIPASGSSFILYRWLWAYSNEIKYLFKGEIIIGRISAIPPPPRSQRGRRVQGAGSIAVGILVSQILEASSRESSLPVHLNFRLSVLFLGEKIATGEEKRGGGERAACSHFLLPSSPLD